MGVYEWLEQLQEKPEHTRRRIVAMLSILAIVIVGGLWVVSIKDRLATSIANPVASLETENVENNGGIEIGGPFESFRDALGTGFANIQEQFSVFQKELFSSNEIDAPEERNRMGRPLPIESQ